MTSTSALRHRAWRRAEHRPHLHLVELGLEDPEPHAARAEHRVAPPRVTPRPRLSSSTRPLVGQLDSAGVSGRNSFSGGSSRRTYTGRPSIASKMRVVVVLLQREAARSIASRARLVVVGQDHVRHQVGAVAEEHVLAAAQADALGAELDAPGGRLGVVGVGPYTELAQLVGPAQNRLEAARETSGAITGTSSVVSSPVEPLMAMKSPSASSCPSSAACGRATSMCSSPRR